MNENDLTAISRIESEIDKIDKKQNNIFFFVIDTKGNPNGSLEYIYKLARILNDKEYHVTMLYQKEKEDEFEGVESWLGEKYASLPHMDITNDEVKVAPSDILFIPEIFANVMIQTRKLPCKRIALVQNYDYILEQMPMSSQWGDLGIMEALTNSDVTASYVKEIFPYVKTTTIKPYIDNIYGSAKEPKKMIINVISNSQEDINKIVKPFYWKYPMYKWVSFRDLRGFPKERYAEYLREAAITIWLDRDTSFGYGALEAMKSGSIVIAHTTDTIQEWMKDKEGRLNNSCVWFNNYHDAHKIIASVVRAWITDNVPEEIENSVSEALSYYSYDDTVESLITFVDGICSNRKHDMTTLIDEIKKKN